jgi:cyanoexosortase A
MKLDIRNRVKLHESSFWVSVLGISLVILHLQLPFLLSPNFNYIILHSLAWGGATYLIWLKRKVLPIATTDLISGIMGAGLIALVLIRSWYIQGNADVLFEISPLFSALGIILIYTGIKGLLGFWRELAMVAISVIPTAHLMPYLDRMINFSLLAAKFSSIILYYAGFEVTRQDLIISLPKGAIEVFYGCSGLPAIVSLLQLGALFVIFCPVPRIIVLLLPLIGAVIAFTVNGVRIGLMALLIDAQDRPAFEYWHGDSGAQIFSLISMFIFCWICEWIWERSHSETNSEAG